MTGNNPQRRGDIREIRAHRAEMRLRTVRQDRIDRQNILARISIAKRTRAAGIVAGHAADGRARGGGDIDRKPQAVRFQRAIEVIEHDARLDHAAAAFDIELQNAIEIFRAIEDQRVIDRLAALRGAAAAREDADMLFLGDGYGGFRLVNRPGGDHPHRHHLIMRCIGRIAAARERVEPHFARDFRFQTPFEPRHQAVGQSDSPHQRHAASLT